MKDFLQATEPILRRFLENIDNPSVFTPLGLGILCVIAYPITKFEPILYLWLILWVLALGADWTGRVINRKTGPSPKTQGEFLEYLARVQLKAAAMMEQGKPSAASDLVQSNLEAAEQAVKEIPNDSNW